ncbi:hypothetical protein ACQ859_15985 [Roseateles chitinivorans]|uniref:hypothetical protein n=1 Tax=Roseateles chitinivorans TaxID=2917965 RepID=UPI00261EE69B|nr:hypothetical protein [uncultured Roseateles sp.]
MSTLPTKSPIDRRSDPARRDAFSQRDRSKRPDVIASQPKSVSKLAALDTPNSRLI